MSEKRQIFRQVALERLSSPEQLDQLMQITTPRGWVALAALLVLLAVALLWGVFGSIPTEAAGQGILLRQGGVSDVATATGGQVEDILIRVGEAVEKDQVVAVIRQDGVERQLADARARQRDLEAEYEDLRRYAETQRGLTARDLAQKRRNLDSSIATLEANLEILAQRVADKRLLLADGLVTKQDLLATEQEYNTTRDQLAAQRLERNGLELERLEAEQRLTRELEQMANALRDVEQEVREFTARLEDDARVRSPYDGRVLELLVDRGDVVQPGTSILSLELASKDLMAVLFVPAESGKRVAEGMAARVSPANVQREEYGYMLGEVTWVAEFPSTARGMTRLLANEALVSRLMEQGPPVQVNVRLETDPRTPSGYRWSSSAGPPVRVSSGTLVTGGVVVEEQRPIRLVIPKVREAVGM